MADDHDITILTLLRHMQGMEERLLEHIGAVRSDLSVFKQDTAGRFDALNAKADHNHAIVIMQIDHIDERLDDLEVVQVPKLKKAIDMR